MSEIADRLYLHESNANIICDKFACAPFIAKDHPQAIEYVRAGLAMQWELAINAGLKRGEYILVKTTYASHRPVTAIFDGIDFIDGDRDRIYISDVTHILRIKGPHDD